MAPDAKLNDKVNAFIQVELMAMAGGGGAYDDQARKLVADSGLAEESIATILQGKVIMAEYQKWKSSKQGK